MKPPLRIICLLLLAANTFAQQNPSFRIMWYNTENLFDTTDNPRADDDEFLPEGNRRWTPKRYRHKLQQLAKIIVAAGEWQPAALVGLCEVENDSVLSDLAALTPLRKFQYRYCSGESRDERGIRVALLYQRDKFSIIGKSSIPVLPGKASDKATRDILHVWGLIRDRDTLDILLCHFPSRYGGEKESRSGRLNAARLLRHICDSVYRARTTPRLMIMGDFNDSPADKSIRSILQAQPLPKSGFAAGAKTIRDKSLQLVNLFADPGRQKYPGSHKYQGEWTQLDQIIVNAEMLSPQSSIRLQPDSPRLFSPSFLLTQDEAWQDERPKRTYYGYKYEGGFSDHLPLLADWNIYTSQIED